MSKPTSDSRIGSWWFAAGAFAMAASLGAGAAFRWLPDDETRGAGSAAAQGDEDVSFGAEVESSTRSLRAAGLGSARSERDAATQPASSNVTQGAETEASRLEKHVEGFFRPPELGSEDTFVSKPQRATWNDSCAAGPSTGKFSDLARQAAESAGLPLDRYGRDTPSLGLGSLNQFLTDAAGKRFFQLTLASSGEDESRYVIDLFEAADATLRVELSRTRLAPEEGAPPLARSAAETQFEALVSDFRARGFVVLGRGLVVAAAEAEGAVVEMSNGRVSRYESGEVRCYALADEPARCGCVNDLGRAE